MVNTFVASGEFDSPEFPRVFPSFLVRGGLTLALAALAGAWIVHRLPAAAPHNAVAIAPPSAAVASKLAGNPYGALLARGSWAARNPPVTPRPAAVAAAPKAADPYGALFDPGFAAGEKRFLAAEPPAAGPGAGTVLPARKEIASAGDEAAPLPPPRPVLAAAPVAAAPATPPVAAPPAAASISLRRVARSGRGGPAAPPDDRNVFEKLFGLGKPSGPALAYASAEGDDARRSVGALRAPGDFSGPAPRYDRWTAVYDLAAHTVYLPDGTRLEAHSGLGDRLDDPAHVSERNRGATPPHLYELKARDELFHGVQALRLDPVGGGDIFGRAGFLAHTYMLGPNGDSNGCVSFKDYQAFLRAFQSGEVKRLAVVARID
jgi:hypothetical protein